MVTTFGYIYFLGKKKQIYSIIIKTDDSAWMVYVLLFFFPHNYYFFPNFILLTFRIKFFLFEAPINYILSTKNDYILNT